MTNNAAASSINRQTTATPSSLIIYESVGPVAAALVAGMEDHSIRRVVSELDEDERQALLVLADCGVAAFSADFVVDVLGFFVNLFT
jgi:hypothetical protein